MSKSPRLDKMEELVIETNSLTRSLHQSYEQVVLPMLEDLKVLRMDVNRLERDYPRSVSEEISKLREVLEAKMVSMEDRLVGEMRALDGRVDAHEGRLKELDGRADGVKKALVVGSTVATLVLMVLGIWLSRGG